MSYLTRSAVFYDAVLSVLGMRRVWSDIRPGEQHQAIGFGFEDGKDLISIKERGADAAHPGKGFHLALGAPNIEAVFAFHAAAIASGGIGCAGTTLARVRSELFCGVCDRPRWLAA